MKLNDSRAWSVDQISAKIIKYGAIEFLFYNHNST